MKRPVVKIGDRYGRWSVIGPGRTHVTPSGAKKLYWACRCDCGQVDQVRTEHLRSGRSQSCGCWKSEAATIQKRTHGARFTPLYEVWTQMLQRCENPRNKGYDRYGGRGIKVCARWHQFEAFAQDMAAGYVTGLTIDRENNDRDYEPTNCRWVTNLVNCRNTRKVIRVQWRGQEMALRDVAESMGLKPNTVYSRYQVKGWTLHQALGLERKGGRAA